VETETGIKKIDPIGAKPITVLDRFYLGHQLPPSELGLKK